MTMNNRTRWFALYVLCLGSLMIVLDATIVNVALPSIRKDLGFSQTSLAWVVNAYLLTFGGCLLLGGRLGDLYGHRRLFLIGISLFTLSSLACGLAASQEVLIGARAVQGVGGAIASAVSLSLMMTLFTEPADRAKAMGVFGFVAAGGGSIGVTLGGVLTDSLDWHWIFLVNFPIGLIVVALSLKLLPAARIEGPACPARRRGCGHRDRVAHARRLRDRERQPGGVDLACRPWACSVWRPCSWPPSSASSRASRRRSCPCASSACATWRRRTWSGSSGRRRCSPGSSSRPSTCSLSSATRRSRSGSPSCPPT